MDRATVRWNRGDVALKRIVWHERVWAAWPDIVVEDSDERLVLYTAPGTEWIGPRHPTQPEKWAAIEHLADASWVPGRLIWENPTLIILPPESWFELVLWFEGDRFHSWKVNLQTPYVRTLLGFDTRDLFLDVEVLPDMRWRWLDEDELAEARARKLVSKVEEDAIRDAGRRVIELVERGASPFRDGWEGWKPDPNWRPPVLPPGWDEPAGTVPHKAE